MEEDPHKLSVEAEALLREFGWFSGRVVPTDGWEQLLASNGFVMHNAARQFLAEFGGIEIPYPLPTANRGKMALSLNPTSACHDDSVYEFLSDEAGVPVYPIGDVDCRTDYLGIAEDGSVYAGLDAFTRLGDSPRQALEVLLLAIAEMYSRVRG
ncbi:SUKH-3 domain-containing protein [Actinokineospora spheciospongiae]|uniref:SUKH-3 domain-containing protein n=1 Tax=Actinokineospora spheciospongiae TaxID=909613 RepID=UPI000D98EA23|nr:SUKH-3 domain-containing protein [Actinokineospora spheciospongiae]PWW67198.1 SUKH-3 immunity protein of toxin-antitoxin system [Actinokineospora spheciospongiae]